MLEELLRLLSCDGLDEEKLAQAAAFVRGAPDDPELAWIEDARQATAFAVCDRLHDFVAESDKIDELHEQLSDMFADPRRKGDTRSSCSTLGWTTSFTHWWSTARTLNAYLKSAQASRCASLWKTGPNESVGPAPDGRKRRGAYRARSVSTTRR